MMQKKYVFGMVIVVLSAATLSAGCAAETGELDQSLDGEGAQALVATTATFDAANGLRIVDDALAGEWSQMARGVWRHESGTQQLIIGVEGHRWAVEQTEAELAALYEQEADVAKIERKEGLLLMQQNALAAATDEVSAQAECKIGVYTGPASPFFGVVGAAGLAQLSCTNGTVVFTVQTQACTGSTGCGPVNVQTAVPDSIPRLWGSGRFGTGICSSTVLVTPPYILRNGAYGCG